MDILETKGSTPDLDLCKVFTICKEKLVSQLEISKDYKLSFSLMKSFL